MRKTRVIPLMRASSRRGGRVSTRCRTLSRISVEPIPLEVLIVDASVLQRRPGGKLGRRRKRLEAGQILPNKTIETHIQRRDLEIFEISPGIIGRGDLPNHGPSY